MKWIDTIFIAGFAIAAPASWCAEEFGQFDWSIYSWVPNSVVATERALEGGVRQLLGSVDGWANPQPAEQEQQGIDPGDRGDACALEGELTATTTHQGFSQQQWFELWRDRWKVKTQWQTDDLTRHLGSPYCLLDDGKTLRWLAREQPDKVLDIEMRNGRVNEVRLFSVPESQ